MKNEEIVRLKHPKAYAFKSSVGGYQIWVPDSMISFAGDKLGSGATEADAWKDAVKTVRKKTG